MIARLEQQICEMKDEVGYVQDAAECKDPELKYGEGPGSPSLSPTATTSLKTI